MTAEKWQLTFGSKQITLLFLAGEPGPDQTGQLALTRNFKTVLKACGQTFWKQKWWLQGVGVGVENSPPNIHQKLKCIVLWPGLLALLFLLSPMLLQASMLLASQGSQ